jgi:hypothetical protein
MNGTDQAFVLTERERLGLETIAREREGLPARRARTLLVLAELKSEWSTVEACGVGIEVLRRWRSIFEAERSSTGAPRVGRRRSRTRGQVSPLVKPILRQSPRRFGYSSDRWDASTLRMHLGSSERIWVPVEMLWGLIDEESDRSPGEDERHDAAPGRAGPGDRDPPAAAGR